MSELEDLIRKRAHEIWERVGRPHGRHEEHWRLAADEITHEIERIKADHKLGSDREEAPAPKRGRRAAGAATAEAAPTEARPARRGTSKVQGSAQSEPVSGEAGAAPRAHGRKAAAEGPKAEPATVGAKRARKPKAQPAAG